MIKDVKNTESLFLVRSQKSTKLLACPINQDVVSHVGPILVRKHNTSEQVTLLNYSALTYADLHNLKYWKENNFLILLDLEDLFILKDPTLLNLVLRRAPLLLKCKSNYLRGPHKGPICVNRVYEILRTNTNVNIKLLKAANNVASAFLTLKNSFFRIYLKDSYNVLVDGEYFNMLYKKFE